MKFILSISIILYTCSLSAQVDFSDLNYDSTEELKDSSGIVFQRNFFQDGELCMIKQYAKGASLKDFGLSRNFNYDSVYVHLGDNNYICLFNKGGNSTRVYQWNRYDNVLSNITYDRAGTVISRLVDIRTPTLYSLYPSKWNKGKYIGQLIGIMGGKPEVIFDYDKGRQFYHRKTAVNDSIHKDILDLKLKAEEVLKNFYHEKFIEEHIVWNINRSGFHRQGHNLYSASKQPSLGTGNDLFFYTPEKYKIEYVDFAFDICVGNNQYPSLIFRLNQKGMLVNSKLKNWDQSINNSSQVMTEKKIKSILPIETVIQKAREAAKFKFENDITISLKWHANQEGDSLGTLAYEIIYDRSKQRHSAYARQILINATSGEFILEKELADHDMEVNETSKFQENGKFGLKSWEGIILPAIYDEVPRMASAFMVCKKDGLYGIVNRKNETLVPFEYESLSFHKSETQRNGYRYLIARKDGKVGCIERYGDWILPLEFETITENDLEQLVAKRKNGRIVLYDTRAGKIIE